MPVYTKTKINRIIYIKQSGISRENDQIQEIVWRCDWSNWTNFK